MLANLSWILKDCIKVQEKKSEVFVLCSHPRQNMKLQALSCCTCAKTARKCTKKRDAWCSATINLLLLGHSHCCSRRCYLSSLMAFEWLGPRNYSSCMSYSICYKIKNKQTILQFPFNTHLLRPKPCAVLHKSHWYSFSTIKKKNNAKI